MMSVEKFHFILALICALFAGMFASKFDYWLALLNACAALWNARLAWDGFKTETGK